MAKILKLKQATVVKLFEALGFKTAKTWNEERLLKKVKQLPELVDGVEIKNPKAKAILDKILKAKKVRIRMQGDVEETERPSEAAMRKSDGGEKKSSASKKYTKEEQLKRRKKDNAVIAGKKTSPKKASTTGEKDKFGSTVGGKKAANNKCLSNKPKSMKELAAMAKLSGTFYDHLNSLVKKKFVKKTEKGFVLAGK